jgi:hypothetical protein
MRVLPSSIARFPAWLWLSCLLLLTSSCAHSPGTSAEPVAAISTPEYSVADHADDLLEKAVEAESWVTPALTYLAELQQGEMIGLEFRLKSRDSTIRKIETRMLERGYEKPRDVPIRDSLRYTMQFGDQPAGHHNQSVAYVLATMEGLGHTVIVVKNYWPRGDDYSGINTILQAPNGLAWELQFHTPYSFELKMSSHEIYEQVREPGVTIETRRLLFNQVADEWELVPIPVGILEPGSLHLLEELILRPSP